MNSLELLLEDYKIIVDIGEKYFDRMYSTLNFVILFYGAILALIYGTDNSAPMVLIFYYYLPVGTYILGLFYAYNSFAITKQGLYLIKIEKQIKKISRKQYKARCNYLGWNIWAKSKKYNGNYILPYGTSLCFLL